MTNRAEEQLVLDARANGNEPAGTIPGYDRPYGERTAPDPGLTKREYIAAKVLQGLLSNSDYELSHSNADIAKAAVSYADLLLQALEK